MLGPYAHLRPESRIGEGAHVGNFVETKKITLGKGSKANHLTYLGDAVIGAGVNIGAGAITCNYDGVNKHLTTIGDGVFVGSDSTLVAPVTLGDGAYVAAGSCITHDVPAGALALGRSRQVTKPGWAAARRALIAAKKIDKLTPQLIRLLPIDAKVALPEWLRAGACSAMTQERILVVDDEAGSAAIVRRCWNAADTPPRSPRAPTRH